MKLTVDEREELANMMQSAGWPVLIKVLEALAQNHKDAVMKYNLTDGPEGLVIKKARAEGAIEIVRSIIARRDKEVRSEL